MQMNVTKRPGTSSYEKLRGNAGVARLVVILAALTAVMLAVVLLPVYSYYRAEADRIACVQSLDSAYRQIAIDYLSGNEDPTPEEVRAVAERSMLGWDDICPSGGSVYVVETGAEDSLPYELVCGLHGTDRKQCTRLNSYNVYEQLLEAVKSEQLKGNGYPESVELTLHHKPLTACLIDDYSGLKRGTAKTMGAEGTVVYYSIVGHSDFGKDSGLKEGRVWYFSYADEYHCASWSFPDGWSGDSYYE